MKANWKRLNNDLRFQLWARFETCMMMCSRIIKDNKFHFSWIVLWTANLLRQYLSTFFRLHWDYPTWKEKAIAKDELNFRFKTLKNKKRFWLWLESLPMLSGIPFHQFSGYIFECIFNLIESTFLDRVKIAKKVIMP